MKKHSLILIDGQINFEPLISDFSKSNVIGFEFNLSFKNVNSKKMRLYELSFLLRKSLYTNSRLLCKICIP